MHVPTPKSGQDTAEYLKSPDESVADTPAAAPRLDFLAPPQGPGDLGRLGYYRVLKVLGRGGMGIVFLAEDTKLERPVALKVMLPKFAEDTAAR